MLTHAHCHRRNAIFPPMAQRFHAAPHGKGGAALKRLAVDAASAWQAQTLVDIDTHDAYQEATPDDYPVGSVCR
ncbi:conserved hypothetical protein [Xanthomonas citri pv. citri]|nr:conserved hypothetical protein [Xanthomonas citri pv. citri]CEJ47748.1 conserved hypothetical protein [Xanthomonas citri pv. bilvae]CEE39278.1 conserved hypothetical protein [Xanthomonas citri pv. citri]CEE46986.1 conserved hypothetical protein [Xanthomonas citri pv. citri]CEE75976.1 conserved hypothetical protein [Xanthomonas citri pv. citri]